jgi:hypothetical protein
MRDDGSAVRTRFVILAAPRSGSNMLCTMLDSHPSILCHHEIFNPRGIRVAWRLRDTGFTLGDTDERERDPESFLERVWATRLGRTCVGFKLTHRQNERIFRRALSDPAIAKIVLRRANRLKTYVSTQIAEAIDQWEVYRSDDLVRDRPRIRLDWEDFLKRVTFDEAYYKEIDDAARLCAHSSITVQYENLHSTTEQNRILRFLGLNPAAHGLRIESIKQNSSDLRNLVENYDELLHQFAGTPFEAELKDCTS